MLSDHRITFSLSISTHLTDISFYLPSNKKNLHAFFENVFCVHRVKAKCYTKKLKVYVSWSKQRIFSKYVIHAGLQVCFYFNLTSRWNEKVNASTPNRPRVIAILCSTLNIPLVCHIYFPGFFLDQNPRISPFFTAQGEEIPGTRRKVTNAKKESVPTSPLPAHA